MTFDFTVQQICEELPLKILNRLYGPAFDARYMSIAKSLENDDSVLDAMDNIDRKRSAIIKCTIANRDILLFVSVSHQKSTFMNIKFIFNWCLKIGIIDVIDSNAL